MSGRVHGSPIPPSSPGLPHSHSLLPLLYFSFPTENSTRALPPPHLSFPQKLPPLHRNPLPPPPILLLPSRAHLVDHPSPLPEAPTTRRPRALHLHFLVASLDRVEVTTTAAPLALRLRSNLPQTSTSATPRRRPPALTTFEHPHHPSDPNATPRPPWTAVPTPSHNSFRVSVAVSCYLF